MNEEGSTEKSLTATQISKPMPPSLAASDTTRLEMLVKNADAIATMPWPLISRLQNLIDKVGGTMPEGEGQAKTDTPQPQGSLATLGLSLDQLDDALQTIAVKVNKLESLL